jgi:hypothetical protein
MADEDTPQCKVEYLDLPDGATEETNWIKRAGKCKVTYVNGHTFEGFQYGANISSMVGINE